MGKTVGKIISAPVKFVTKNIISPVAEAVGSVIQPFAQTSAELVSPLLSEAGQLAAAVVNPIVGALQPAIASLANVVSSLGPLIRTFTSIISGDLTNMSAVLDSVIRDLGRDIIRQVGREAGPLRQVFERAGTSTVDSFIGFLGLTQSELSNKEGSLATRLKRGADKISDSLDHTKPGLAQRIFAMLEVPSPEPRAGFLPVAAPAVGLVLAPLVRILWAAGVFFALWIYGWITEKDGPAEEGDFKLSKAWLDISEIIADSAESVVAKVGPIVETAHRPVAELFRTIGESIIFGVEDQLNLITDVSPHNVDHNAGVLAGKAVEFATAAHLASTGMGVIPGFKHLGVNQFPALLAGMAGFAPMIQATFGEKVWAALRRPGRQAANMQFPSEIPDTGDASEMYTKRKIARSEWEEIMSMHGFNDGWRNLLHTVVWKVLTDGDIMRIHEAGLTNIPEMAEQFKEFQYEEHNILPLVESMASRAERIARGPLVSTLFAGIRDGLFDPAEMDETWRDLLYNERSIEMNRKRGEVEVRRKVVSDSITRARRARRTNLISLNEFRTHIEGLGLAPWKVQSVISLEETIEEGRIFNEPTKARGEREKLILALLLRESLNAFKKDQITDHEFFANVVGLGVVPEVAEAYLRLAEQEKRDPFPRKRKLSPQEIEQRVFALQRREVEAAFQRGLLKPAEAIANLVGLGVPAAEAAAKISLIETILTKPPGAEEERERSAEELTLQRARRVTAFESFRRVELTSEQLLASLVAAGTPTAVASEEVRRETLRLEARNAVARERDETREEAEAQRLIAAEQREQERAITALTRAIQREEEATTLSALRRNIINAQDALFNLVALGLDPRLAESKVDRVLVGLAEPASLL